MDIRNLTNENRKIVQQQGCFSVLSYLRDASVNAMNAEREYFMDKMDVRRRQVMISLNGNNAVTVQAGAMQWMAGNVEVKTGVQGVGDFLGKMVKSSLTKETAVKPVYYGAGIVMLEPTYKHILLQDVASWGPQGMTIEDGMFLACDSTVQHDIVARSNFSSAVAGGEGLFNLSLRGNGIVALESNVPQSELIEVSLDNSVLKIDGRYAVCWSTSLQFTVERTTKTLIGSAASGEGLVNVYRGTGRVLLAPVTPSYSMAAATNSISR